MECGSGSGTEWREVGLSVNRKFRLPDLRSLSGKVSSSESVLEISRDSL